MTATGTEGEKMVVVPLSKPANDSAMTPEAKKSEVHELDRIAAGGTLVAAGLLLLVGERRAGIGGRRLRHSPGHD